MGELISTLEISLEVLSGIVNPNRVNPIDDELQLVPHTLKMMMFDALSIEEFQEGHSDIPYLKRRQRLLWSKDHTYVETVQFMLPVVVEEAHIVQTAAHAIDQGYEGIVICDISADWVAGHKGYRKMKMVRGISLDLRCVGYEEGTGKLEGHMVNLLMAYRTQSLPVMFGKGWTYPMLEEAWEHRHTDSPVGKIFEVYALQESSQGALRLPKIGELRHDKEDPDTT